MDGSSHVSSCPVKSFSVAAREVAREVARGVAREVALEVTS